MIVSRCKFTHTHLWIFIIYLSGARTTNANFLDWIWSSNQNAETFIRSEGPILPVPFEYKTEDEKFLEEASKFTDIMKTSSLDICQHKVILKLKTSCTSMTEEEMAKMSVNLLNCQSEVDERKVFPCTESMSLKECTKDMDANMWNAYHLMNNRARAVCLTARRAQFQALSEMTVNKLMATAHDQINKMTTLIQGQEKLEILTLGTLDSVEKGNTELMEQQEKLITAQKTVKDFVTFNLEQLTQEKALIAAGNQELAKMTKNIKEKLDAANEQLSTQSEERSENHRKLLEDIEALQTQARSIFQRIDSSTEKLLAQHEVASSRYKDAVENLIKINDTVHYLLKVINTTRNEIDEKLHWIQDFLDGTGTNIERLSSITFHIAYLLVGMLFASFLNFSTTSRAALAAIVPMNLFVTYNKGSEMALNFSEMTILLSATVLGIAVIHKLQSFFAPKNHNRERLSYSGETQGEIEPKEREHKRSNQKSKNAGILGSHFLGRYFNKLSSSLNQLLNFIFGWVGKNSRTSSKPAAKKSNENLGRSSFGGDKNGSLNGWDEYSNPMRDRYQQSVHNRVNEWLQTKIDCTPRPGSASSTSRRKIAQVVVPAIPANAAALPIILKTNIRDNKRRKEYSSGSPKFYCSAVCRSGRRCKNVSSPGRDVCHRHLIGTSIAS